MSKSNIKVQVIDMQSTVYEAEVDRITSFNEVGPFDIYPMHANFITMIQKKLSFYLKHETLKEMEVDRAVMKVKKDMVKIFLGIGTIFTDEDIDKSSQDNSNKDAQKK